MQRLAPIILALGALAASGCGGADDSHGASASVRPSVSGGGTSITLVAYSTPQVVYDELIPAFRATGAGSDVGFKTSFGASGEQSRAVEAGLKADVVSLSIEPDVERLVKAGLVATGWKAAKYDGQIATSVVSFIVRKGNPKKIRTWGDLLKPGVEVLTPNPFTSGAAKWNLLGAYAAASNGGKSPEAGLAYVEKLITEHVEVQDKSGREALQSFLSGNGDVLLSYEYEATTALKKGEENIEYVVPDDTMNIEINVATLKDAKPEAKTFVDYALSQPGQRKFAEWGYRPVNPNVLAANRERFPEPAKLRDIEDLGGWGKVNEELFDPEKGAIAEIEEKAGVSTAR